MTRVMWTTCESELHSFRNGLGDLAMFLPSLDGAFEKMKLRFVEEKRSHYERCS